MMVWHIPFGHVSFVHIGSVCVALMRAWTPQSSWEGGHNDDVDDRDDHGGIDGKHDRNDDDDPHVAAGGDVDTYGNEHNGYADLGEPETNQLGP